MKMTLKALETGKYIQGFLKRNGRKPILEEIMKRFNLHSTSSAWERVQRYNNYLGICPFCGTELPYKKVARKKWWQKINPESYKGW
jgi:hypothetical protein